MKQLCPRVSHLPSPGLRDLKHLMTVGSFELHLVSLLSRDLNSRSVSLTTVNDRHESFSVACADRSQSRA